MDALDQKHQETNRLIQYLWSTIFALSTLEGLIALLAVASLPSDQDVRVVLGVSAGRLILLALMVALILLFICLALLNLHSTWHAHWDEQMRADARWGSLLFITCVICRSLTSLCYI